MEARIHVVFAASFALFFGVVMRMRRISARMLTEKENDEVQRQRAGSLGEHDTIGSSFTIIMMISS